MAMIHGHLHLDALRHDVGVGWCEGTVVRVADVVNATHLEPRSTTLRDPTETTKSFL